MRNSIAIGTERDLRSCLAYVKMAIGDIRSFRKKLLRAQSAEREYWDECYQGSRWFPGTQPNVFGDERMLSYQTVNELLKGRDVVIVYETDHCLTSTATQIVYISNESVMYRDKPGAPDFALPTARVAAICVRD